MFIMPRFLQRNSNNTGKMVSYTRWSGWLRVVLTVHRLFFLFFFLTTCKVFEMHLGQYETPLCATDITKHSSISFRAKAVLGGTNLVMFELFVFVVVFFNLSLTR